MRGNWKPSGSLSSEGRQTKQEVLDMLTELCRRNPRAAAPQDALAVRSQKADALVRHILDVFNSTELTAQQAKDVPRTQLLRTLWLQS
jgi:hypothetical protein